VNPLPRRHTPLRGLAKPRSRCRFLWRRLDCHLWTGAAPRSLRCFTAWCQAGRAGGRRAIGNRLPRPRRGGGVPGPGALCGPAGRRRCTPGWPGRRRGPCRRGRCTAGPARQAQGPGRVRRSPGCVLHVGLHLHQDLRPQQRIDQRSYLIDDPPAMLPSRRTARWRGRSLGAHRLGLQPPPKTYRGSNQRCGSKTIVSVLCRPDLIDSRVPGNAPKRVRNRPHSFVCGWGRSCVRRQLARDCGGLRFDRRTTQTIGLEELSGGLRPHVAYS
jgi:hypothetical protein